MSEKSNYSDELNALLSYIKDTLSVEYPAALIGPDYFVVGIMSMKECDAFKFLSANMTGNIFNKVWKGFVDQVSSSALNVVKPGRECKFDSRFEGILAEAENDRMAVGADTLTSNHVLMSILRDNSENNKIRKTFNSAGITYSIMLGKVLTTTGVRAKMAENEKARRDEMKKNIKNFLNNIPYNPINNGTEPNQVNIFFSENGNLFGDAENIDPDEMAKIISFDPAKMIFGIDPSDDKKNKKQGKGNVLSKYCTNLNDLALSGKIDKIVGRERETDEIIRVLGRRKKNNAILLGGEGVGKTAIAENLAYRIVNKDVPPFLLNKRVVSLDMTALMAGTTLRGMFEERVQNIINEMKENGDYILMIDNIGAVLADKGKGDYDISAMLSNALENGDIQVIGTSDYKSFRSTFDKDPSLSRKFQKIVVEAPSLSDSIKILFGIKEYYEKYHRIAYTDKAVRSCVELADRYITERNLPDSAIDILDEAGSLVGNRGDDLQHFKELSDKLAETNDAMKAALKQNDQERADALDAEGAKIAIEMAAEKKRVDRERKNNPPVVDENEILSIVSKKTGIPMSKLTLNDKQKLATMDERLKMEVIGQDEAIDDICRSLKRNRVGLHGGGCMFSGILIGKTGVGKTLISKKLAKEMFGDEKALIRFDMSEYPDKTAVNKLIGSNPGYVGYEDGGQLTEAIKNHKHCVLLLDEIEKADPEIYNLFLQVLDEGFLTDNSGMKVDFKNVIVLFTSNVGARAASEFGKPIGFGDDGDDNSKRILLKELKRKFPPEFLNRLDGVIYFNNLTDDNIRDIIRLEMNKMINNVKEIGFDAQYDDDVVNFLLEKVKDEREFGARPVVRAIRTEIEDKLTDIILENEYPEGQIFRISANNVEKEARVSAI